MSFPFDPSHGPILVKAEVTGPDRSLALQLILDTGATTSLLNDAVLLTLGYDLANVTDRVQMTTGGQVISVLKVVLTRLTALGGHRFGFPVLAHTLPVGASVHGLLGLDFLRGVVLTVDFRSGGITLG
ncbi:MAG TPA: retropepsin-like aspartic protease [Isosphaeraceae bacterium]|nr:retropepsin-like aspartic protease [Isosphaeraceae bacterium]